MKKQAADESTQLLVAGICSEISLRSETKADMARSSARGQSEVSSSELQEMKDTMRFFDEEIAEKSAKYRRVAGIKFSPKLCK